MYTYPQQPFPAHKYKNSSLGMKINSDQTISWHVGRGGGGGGGGWLNDNYIDFNELSVELIESRAWNSEKMEWQFGN